MIDRGPIPCSQRRVHFYVHNVQQTRDIHIHTGAIPTSRWIKNVENLI